MSSDDLVAPGVRRIQLPLPFSPKIVNVYLVEGAHEWALVDTGVHLPETVAALDDALTRVGIRREDVRRAFVTHVHRDHFGNAGLLERAGTQIVMHKPEAEAALRMWGPEGTGRHQFDWFARHGLASDVTSPRTSLDDGVDCPQRIVTVDDGEIAPLADRRTRMIWTPGHTDYHAVLLDEDDGILFAGDHVLPRIAASVGWYATTARPDPLGDFLGALRRVATLPVTRVLPAHGDPFTDLQGRAETVLAHHAGRLDRAVAALEGGAQTAWQVTQSLSPRIRNSRDERFVLAETLAHLRHLETLGRARQIEGTPVTWRLA